MEKQRTPQPKKKKTNTKEVEKAKENKEIKKVPGAVTEVEKSSHDINAQTGTAGTSGNPNTSEALAEQEEMDLQNSHLTESSRPGSAGNGKAEASSTNSENISFEESNEMEYDMSHMDLLRATTPQENRDTLADIYRLLDSMEEGVTDQDPDAELPLLFNQPEHAPNYQKISELRIQLEDEEVSPYLQDFHSKVKDDVLMIGNISLEEVQEEERRLRDEHIAYEEQQNAMVRHRQQQILVREDEAKRRVAKDMKEKRKVIQRRLELLQQSERLMMDKLHKAFRRAENQLLSTLERRKGEVKTMFGDLTVSEGTYGGSKGRRWRVDWDRTPQPIQIKLKTLGGVKDKLPGGRYVLMVSLYNCLGGKVMRWSNLRGQRWGGTTLPIHHDGRFYNTEIKLEQSVFTVLPSHPDIRPGMVLIFELFLLRGATVPTDRVVGWGCFPIADGTFNVVEGKFKAPFLRGEADDRVTKHSMIEELMSSELDHWLCNLYFEVVKLPRYFKGQKEYEVELQFSSGLINYPDRLDTGGEEYRDGEVPVPGSDPAISDASSSHNNVDADRSYRLNVLAMSTYQAGESSVSSHDNSSDASIRKPPLPVDANDEKHTINYNKMTKSPSSVASQSRPTSVLRSHSLHKNRTVKVAADSDSEEYDEEDVMLMNREEGFFPVRGQPGMYYKKYRTNNIDEYHKKLYALLPKTPLLTKKTRKKRLTYQEELESHTFSVNDPVGDKGHPSSANSTKMQYVARQMLAELGLSQWRSRQFWAMVFLFILVYFMRMYLHYVSQWLFLQGVSIPINRFDFSAYTVYLNYQPSLLSVAEEALVVLLGVFGNILVFVFFVLLCWVIQRLIGFFPDVGCKFVLILGIHAFLDPFFIAITDTALQRWSDLGGDVPIADYAKIYWNYYRAEGSGLAGIFITLFLYIFTCFASAAVLYMYFLRLHNNGRMLDIYWRLHGEEDMFFVPHDMEISNQELAYLVKKAEQWRGEEGERRKIAVYDYIWEEEMMEDQVWDKEGEATSQTRQGKTEITTHVSIHTLHLDGLRELYRHWLRMHDGAIVEVFGDMSVSGIDKDITSTLTKQTHQLENYEQSLEAFTKLQAGVENNSSSELRFDNQDKGSIPIPAHKIKYN